MLCELLFPAWRLGDSGPRARSRDSGTLLTLMLPNGSLEPEGETRRWLTKVLSTQRITGLSSLKNMQQLYRRYTYIFFTKENLKIAFCMCKT